MLTKKQYAESCGVVCPACESDNVQAGDDIHDGGIIIQEVECLSCGSQWNDIFKLTGYTDLVKK